MKKHFLLLSLTILSAACVNNRAPQAPVSGKTIFQTSQPWSEYTDNRADAVLVYGVGGEGNPLEKRLASWKQRGYETLFMTGIAWGGYQDYFTGVWDGTPHWDEGQVNVKGDTLWHGKNVPYIVPTQNFLNYFKQTQIKRAINAGVDQIFLEEPEFWAEGGYSDAFKREWEAYYGSPWRPQDESPEATYLSSKLKYHLYYRALEETFTYAKEYGKSLGRDIRCYVPTHSLVNYSQWQIVSPEASLASLPCVDGYIGQVWTGTSRVPEYYNGVLKERVFENAYLEYGSIVSMTAPTHRRVWLLTDPIEDRARDWEDFSRNYLATFTAQMLFPQMADYEVMPWPERIYRRPYPTRKGSEEMSTIPGDFSARMHVMIRAARDIRTSEEKVNGSQGLAVLMANSLMFQRFPVHEGYEDPQLSSFYGLALPLVKRGVPVEIVHIENLGYPKALEAVKVLLMTYANMKPLDSDAHTHLQAWVKKGGQLIYCATDRDPFQRVSEWWNRADEPFAAPSDHLFSLMGIPSQAPSGTYRYGKGTVRILRQDPKEFVLTAGADAPLMAAVSAAYGPLEQKNHFLLHRGPYTVGAVMDESVSEAPLKVDGTLIDLYDPELPVLSEKTIGPGEQFFLYDVRKAPKAPAVLAASSRESDVKAGKDSYSYIAKGPADTYNISRILLPSAPVQVLVSGADAPYTWDEGSRTLLVRFPNSPDGVTVQIRWK